MIGDEALQQPGMKNRRTLHVHITTEEFVEDLHSGNLHKRFHAEAEQKKAELEKFKQEHNIQADLEDRREEKMPIEPIKTAPPESVFKELKPSGKRYSLLQKTEL
ncbi:hypothetical protein NECAME_06204 [Necator americanus]|uniref:Uncharacterized protein n=1 Tax=Necator americanus TaxID=51031 RepID=W2TXP6_NECAM|nr:hypothetical protein NECAME_06204 [Necator americanus]ETN85787.1 hypothetical protein NECAME_06204 [Necator americanus]